MDLSEARALAESRRLASPQEYLRVCLQVLLALLDRASAPEPSRTAGYSDVAGAVGSVAEAVAAVAEAAAPKRRR